MKKILLLMLLFVLYGGFTFAQEDLEGSFDIRMESDEGDYIGQGKSRHFTDEDDDHFSFNWYNEQENAYNFEVESFYLGNALDFTFEGKDGALKKGNYYPAKRFPFNDSYNGISVGGDGRGCNKIFGGFYVHEIVLNDSDELQKLAIDFVQYCEEGDEGLYGSIRYNSSITSSCTSTSCAKVVQLIEDKEVDDSDVYSDEISEDETQMVIDLLQKIEGKYPRFYNACIVPSLLDEDEILLMQTGKYYFSTNACKGKYKEELTLLNNLLYRVLGSNENGDEGDTPTESELREVKKLFTEIIVKLDYARDALDANNKLTERTDIVLSALAYVFEIGKMGAEIILQRM